MNDPTHSAPLSEDALCLAGAWKDLEARESFETLVPRLFQCLAETCEAQVGYLLIREAPDQPATLWGVRELQDPRDDLILDTAHSAAFEGVPAVSLIESMAELSPEAFSVIEALDEQLRLPAEYRGQGLFCVLRAQGHTYGYARLGNPQWGAADPGVALLSVIAEAGGRHLHRLATSGTQALWEVYRVLARAIDAATESTHEHSASVGECAALVGRELGLSEERCRLLETAGYVHDFGKVVALPKLSAHDGRYTEEELGEVRAAILRGTELLGETRAAQGVAQVLRHLGEHWDGTGHPDGLAGTAIPLESRILAVVHRFYVALQPRPYRSHLAGVAEAVSLLQRQAGKAFDPEVVECFVQRVAGIGGQE